MCYGQLFHIPRISFFNVHFAMVIVPGPFEPIENVFTTNLKVLKIRSFWAASYVHIS